MCLGCLRCRKSTRHTVVQMLHVLCRDGLVVIPILQTKHINQTKGSLDTDLSTKGKCDSSQPEEENNRHGVAYFRTHLLKAIVLVTVWAVPAVPVPIGDHSVVVTEPAIHICVDRLLSVQKGSVSINHSWMYWLRGEQCYVYYCVVFCRRGSHYVFML